MLYLQRSNFVYTHLPFKFKTLPAIKTFSSLPRLLDFCNNIEILQQIHARYIVYGLHQNPTLSSELINSYANLNHLGFSIQVFHSVHDPNHLLYNTGLRNLVKFSKWEETHSLYQEMVEKSMYPDEITYSLILKSCSHVGKGKQIHGHVVKLGFDVDVSVASALVEIYEGNGNAQELFDFTPMKNLTYWSSLISEASQNGNPEESFRVFKQMIMQGIQPDSSIIISLLRSSVALNSTDAGKFVHLLIVVCNLSHDLSVNTALLTMYCKFGILRTAKELFERIPERDCVVWNIMISAYSRNGYPQEALELLRLMVRSGTRTDLFTALASVSLAAELECPEKGKEIHAHVIRHGSDYQVSVHNSLIEMYSKCGSLETAKRVFDSVLKKSVVSWSSMIKGYVNNDQSSDALTLFFKMKTDGVQLDSVTIINILPACASLAALEHLKYFHGYSVKNGLISIVSVVTAFLDSYAKCGCIEMAQNLFDEEAIHVKDTVSWNSMISAHSKHGNWSKCLELYSRMKDSKLRPDRITFLGLLTACVNSGMVKEGLECFNEMTEIYHCSPSQEHYACVVDLLGRSGNTADAVELIKKMPFEPDARVWGPLLSACKMHPDTRLAEYAAKKIICMEPRNAGNYVSLSNIYAAAGKWDEVAKMRIVLRDKGLKKTPGCSWLEIRGRVHEFRVADRSHPKSADIYNILGSLELEIKLDTSKNSQVLLCS